MPAQRKLFLAHASELAHLFVRTVGSARRSAFTSTTANASLVSQFVHSYAERFNRPGLAINPERNREFDSTIGREALLVMAAKVYLMLPEAFAQGSGKGKSLGHPGATRPGKGREKIDPQEVALAQAFFAEFLASLARSLEWPHAEAAAEDAAFRRDLEMYRRWGDRSRSGAPSAETAEQSPFADRCALLLDPAMMEQARRAAVEFEVELAHAAARMFNQLGRRSAPRTKSHPRPKPRRKKKRGSPRRSPKKKPTRSRRPKKSKRR